MGLPTRDAASDNFGRVHRFSNTCFSNLLPLDSASTDSPMFHICKWSFHLSFQDSDGPNQRPVPEHSDLNKLLLRGPHRTHSCARSHPTQLQPFQRTVLSNGPADIWVTGRTNVRFCGQKCPANNRLYYPMKQWYRASCTNH